LLFVLLEASRRRRCFRCQSPIDLIKTTAGKSHFTYDIECCSFPNPSYVRINRACDVVARFYQFIVNGGGIVRAL
jgi:hypothetical protein